MKKSLLVLAVFVGINSLTQQVNAQTGFTEDFSDNSLAPAWSINTPYAGTETSSVLRVGATSAGTSYQSFSLTVSSLNLTDEPYVKINIRTSTPVKVRIDLQDAAGKTTNTAPLTMDIPGDLTFRTYTYNFGGRFSQTWPNSSTVDASQITKILFLLNPGGPAYTGYVYFDELLVGSNTGIQPTPGSIRINQEGFYPEGPKKAIAISAGAGSFYIVSHNKQDTVYTGTLGGSMSYSYSGETLRQADFTDFDSTGNFFVLVPGIGYSHPFRIEDNVHHAVSKAGVKAFYYQRASIAIQSAYGGIWSRAKGHPDNVVKVHNSAASPGRPANSNISSPRGWYDAGDYNKYVITAGISTYMLLAMHEHYPSYMDTLDLDIPESNNSIPDVLDEALWEIRWLLTMQDPYDGGVYFKLTNANFDGDIMPSDATNTRYVVQKSTTSALNFAAIMAQAARIYKQYETQLPGLGDSCINASIRAWKWARKNPSVAYNQGALSNPAIVTGSYGDGGFSDEFQWAGMELYATTKIDTFYTLAGGLTSISVPSWANVRALGYCTLTHLRKNLTSVADTTNIKSILITAANNVRTKVNSSAYGTGMNSVGDYSWGSSGIAATQGMILLQAFNLTKDSSYLQGAVANLDYLLGRNGTNYCFITGYGNLSPMDIHHRIAVADGVTDPVPGLLAGGPNQDSKTDCGSGSYPGSCTYTAKCYLDAYCSYSTNEIAINWNAPFAYLSNVVEAIESGAPYEVINYTPPVITALEVAEEYTFGLNAYPNPAKDKVFVTFRGSPDNVSLTLTDVAGMTIARRDNASSGDQNETFDTSLLNKGMYYLIVKCGNKTEARKIIIE